MAVESAGPYASLRLAPDRQPCQHPTTQFLQAGCPSCRPTNSVKALKAILLLITSLRLGICALNRRANLCRYDGPRCEHVNACISHPCLNGGQCTIRRRRLPARRLRRATRRRRRRRRRKNRRRRGRKRRRKGRRQRRKRRRRLRKRRRRRRKKGRRKKRRRGRRNRRRRRRCDPIGFELKLVFYRIFLLFTCSIHRVTVA